MNELHPPACILLGGGGHARAIIDALQAAGETRSLGVLDADTERAGTMLLGVPILGDDALLPELAQAGTTHFVVTVGSTGVAQLRAHLFEKACGLGLEPLTVRHPTAVISRHASIGPGAQLLALAVVNAGANVGANVIINSGAVVEHDCRLADHVHVATGAHLASGVDVGTASHIGAGAVVRQSISIGARAVVGVGAVVVRDVAADTVVVGNPARTLR